MSQYRIGFIGGSGLYHIEGLTAQKWLKVRTPFGDPSDALLTGRLEGREVVFLPRHGRGHRILPTEVNARANIYALKMLGENCMDEDLAGGLSKARIVGAGVRAERAQSCTTMRLAY